VFEKLLLTALLPAGIAAGVILILLRSRLLPESLAPEHGLGAGALGIGAAYTACHLLALDEGWPGFPPADVTHWALFGAWLATALGLAEVAVYTRFEERPAIVQPARWIPRIALSAGLVFLILSGLAALEETWGSPSLPMLVTGLCAASVLLFLQLDGLASQRSQLYGTLMLSAALGGTAGVVMLAGSAKLSQLTGSLAASMGALFGLVFWSSALTPLRGAVPVIGFVLVAVLVCACSFTDLPPAAAFLLILTPGAARLGRAGPLARAPLWVSVLIGLLGIVGLLGGAAALTHAAAPEPYSPH